MKRGVELEPIAKQLYSAKHNVKLVDVGFVTNGFLGLSPDGIWEDETVATEFKAPREAKFLQHLELKDTEDENDVWREYRWQIAFYFLALPKIKRLDFCEYCKDLGLVEYKISRDNLVIQTCLAIVKQTEPALKASITEAVKNLKAKLGR
jgi:hypothetical protein